MDLQIDDEARMIAAQMGRDPRPPFRVASRCLYGYPTTIASPAVLDDGSVFPTTFWLTCPHLVELASQQESNGMCKQWSQWLAEDAQLADRLWRANVELRAAREAESGSEAHPVCAETGIAGQRDILGVKCLHAHAALALVGLNDPIGEWVLGLGAECADARCEGLCR